MNSLATDAGGPSPLAVRCTKVEAELRQLLEFAVARTEIRLTDDVIRDIVLACSRAAEPTPDVEAELWRQYNRLADVISPATPETVFDLASNERPYRDSGPRQRLDDERCVR